MGTKFEDWLASAPLDEIQTLLDHTRAEMRFLDSQGAFLSHIVSLRGNQAPSVTEPVKEVTAPTCFGDPDHFDPPPGPCKECKVLDQCAKLVGEKLAGGE